MQIRLWLPEQLQCSSCPGAQAAFLPRIYICVPLTHFFLPLGSFRFAQDAIITRMIDGRLALDLHKML